MRVTWPVLVASLVLAFVGLMGGLGAADKGVQRALIGDRAHPDRTPVLLVAIDEASLERIGAPPWSEQTWREIDRSLGRAGLDAVHLVDPVAPLVHGEGWRLHDSVLRAPTVVRHVRGRAVPSVPPESGSLPVESVVLDLPRTQGTVLGLGASAAGSRSAWCRWTSCPTGPDLGAPLSAVDAGRIHTVPLLALLDGGTVSAGTGPVLLGVTARDRASTVPVGPDGLDVTWPEAVALAASAAGGPRVVAPSPLLLAPLLALIVLLGAFAARAERVLPAEAWIAVVPAAAAGAGALIVWLGLGVVPVLSLALAGLLGPLLVALAARRRALRFVRRAALDVARSDLGFVWEDALDGSPAGLLRVLGSLTRNHLPSDQMAWLAPAGRGAVEVVGGWGLSATDFVPDRLTEKRMTVLARRGTAPGLLRDVSSRALVVPLHGPDGRVRGWWCVAWGADEVGPDLDLLVELAGWVERRLQGDARRRRGWFSRPDQELRAIGTALARSAEARASQAKVLAEADFPLATADRAGVFVFRNAAWDRLLGALDVPGQPSSLREIAWRLGGEEGLDERMRRLFVDGDAIEFDTAEGSVRLAPAGGGYVVWAPPPRERTDAQLADETVDRVEPHDGRPIGHLNPHAPARVDRR